MGFLDKFKTDKMITPEERREKSNEKIKKMGIACCEKLPVIEAGDTVKLKSLDAVCKRAAGCLISTQLACSIANGEDYNTARELFFGLLKKYGAENDLLPQEKALFNQSYTQQDVIDVAWSYEIYWAIIWALDLITDKEMAPTAICNCERAAAILFISESYEAFRSLSKFRNIEKILDMLDLYYRYHWACVEKQVHPETPIGKLNAEVVMERRRALEWLISEENDWNQILLDT